VKYVRTSVGPEQEYFLIDQKMFEKRPDLIYTGRTLFGAMPPKGQELDDHYFGAIKPRVAEFMDDLNRELWKLGILAKTEHNEVAPAQHELAPIFSTTNVATDKNQLTMEIMQKVARRHGMVCLLHEKPFAGVNGSGKHNNWSMATEDGTNLLSPGETPYENAQFLLFLCAVIQAVDDYQDLLRISVASPGNDHRLGAHEAPPAVISMFLGDELNGVLEAIENDTPYEGTEKSLLRLGVHTLPKLPKDTTDRNRTSPMAFTGNKFEFRMLGSSSSVSNTNIMFNTAVAESLRLYADELETAEDFRTALHALIRRTVKAHKRIIFNGNGYNDEWIREATEDRGLLNLRTTPDCVPYLLHEKNVALFAQHKVFNETELISRAAVMLEDYSKKLNIEGLTMIEMTRRDILPAIESFAKDTANSALSKRQLLPDLDCAYEENLVYKLSELCAGIDENCAELEAELDSAKEVGDVTARAEYFRDNVIPVMEHLRELCDEAEEVTSTKYWPFPTYGELLFGIR
jgi:glutamine synthetase